MTPGAPSTAVMHVFIFSILGLGLVSDSGCRSSHSDPKLEQLAPKPPAAVVPLSPPDIPAICEKLNLPRELTSNAAIAARPAASTEPNMDRLVAPADSSGGCNPCGGNSPDINKFPFNGLHVDGCANANGDRLLVDSFDPGMSQCDVKGSDKLFLGIAPRDDRDPTLVGYELVATDRKKHTDGKKHQCRGQELAGATFEVWSDQHQTRTKLMISHVAKTSICYAKLPSNDSPLPNNVMDCNDPRTKNDLIIRHERTIYLITKADQSNKSLCTNYYQFDDNGSESSATPSSSAAPYQMPRVHTDTNLLQIMDDALSSYSVIIPGAVFNNEGKEISNSEDPRWFNIACAGNALADTDLTGLVRPPRASQPDNTSLRLRALHMFSAKYAGGVSATNSGTPIAWQLIRQSEPFISIELLNQIIENSRDLQIEGAKYQLRKRNGLSKSPDRLKSIEHESSSQPDAGAPDDDPQVEAQWDEHGATCLCHSRIWMANRVIPVPEQVRSHLSAKQKKDHVTPDLGDEVKLDEELVSSRKGCDVEEIMRAMKAMKSPHTKPDVTSRAAGKNITQEKVELTSFVLGHTKHHDPSDPDPCAPGQASRR